MSTQHTHYMHALHVTLATSLSLSVSVQLFCHLFADQFCVRRQVPSYVSLGCEQTVKMCTCVCSKELLQSQSGLCVNIVLQCGVTGYSVIVVYFTAGTVNEQFCFVLWIPPGGASSVEYSPSSHTQKDIFHLHQRSFFGLETRTRGAVARSDVYQLLHVCFPLDSFGA